MSIGRCGASCAASMKTSAPLACANRAIVATGGTSPVTLEAPLIATSEKGSPACSASSSAAAATSTRPAAVGVNGRCATRCWRHGKRFAWCSNGEHSTRVPGGSAAARGSRLPWCCGRRRRRRVLATDEPGHRGTGLLEQRRRVGALAAAATVQAAIPRDRLLDGVHRCDERRCGRGEVEVDLVELRGSGQSGSATRTLSQTLRYPSALLIPLIILSLLK